MTRLSKADLNGRIVDAVTIAGWTVTPLSGIGEHPLRFDMERGSAKHRVRAYVWNLTHGGGPKRPQAERRIQITGGVSSFKPEPGGTTVILGWNPDPATFAAFDIRHHAKPLGRSPSIQIAAGTLATASADGIAQQRKGKTEIAIAVRTDLLAAYIARWETAHAGDLRAVLAADDAADQPDFVALAGAASDDKVGTGLELEERRQVLERLATLERELQALRPGIAAIGHNNPPEPIEPGRPLPIAEIEDAAGLISSELRRECPNVQSVARQARRLQQAGAEARALLKKIVEKGRERVAEAVTGIIVGGAILLGQSAIEALGAALHHLQAWFLAIGA